MKKYFTIQLLLLFIYAGTLISAPEIWIQNYSSRMIGTELSPRTITVKIYPVSMVFNGLYDYNLLALRKFENSPGPYFFYINGVNKLSNGLKQTHFVLPRTAPFNKLKINHDFDGSGNNGNDITIGFGIYRVDVWWDAVFGEDPPDDYFTIEYDYGLGNIPPIWFDLDIVFRDYASGVDDPRMTFAWDGNNNYRNTRDVGRKLENWNQYERGSREKVFGDFRYDDGFGTTPNNYDIIPQDPRRDCAPEVYSQYPEQNHLFNFAYTINYIDYYGPANIGTLVSKLTIEKNVSTPDYLSFHFGQDGYPPVLPSPIVITNGAALKITPGSNNQERTFRFKKYHDFNTSTPLYIDNYSTLELEGTDNTNEISHMIFENYGFGMVRQFGLLMMRKNSKFTLQQNSQLILKPNSGVAQYEGTWIEVFNGSTLTNCGARFTVYGPRIHVDNNGSRYIISNTCPEDGIPAYDSQVDSGGAIWLSNNGLLSIDPGCKLIFDGTDSYLRAESGTSIILGKGASIEFRNGAYLEANGCTFTSINSGEIWNGIVLDGAGSQTNLQNCTFNDAATSISVTNTVCNITGNTFNISNNTNCVYGISAVNENNITISSNTFNAGQNMVAECIKFFSYDGDGLPGGGGIPAYSLNIFNNVFNGSVYPIDIQCLTAS